MPRKTNKVEQAHNCPDIRIKLQGKRYVLRISSTFYDDRKQKEIPLNCYADRDGLMIAQQKQLELQREINNCSFDFTLERYKPLGEKKRHVTYKINNLQELWEYLCTWKKPLISESRYLQKYVTLGGNVVKAFGAGSAIEYNVAIELRNWLLKNRNKKDSAMILKELSNGCELAANAGLMKKNNPFFGLSEQVSKVKDNDVDTRNADAAAQQIEKKKAYTKTERDAILAEFKEKYPQYYLFTYFRFYTGCRFGEATEIRYSDISSDGKKIIFRRSYSEISNTVGATKTGKARSLNLSANLLTLINPCENSDNNLIFTDNGSRIKSTKYKVFWNRVINSLFEAGTISIKLSQNHTRHTAATIARESSDKRLVAAQLGHSEGIADRHYADIADRDKVLLE